MGDIEMKGWKLVPVEPTLEMIHGAWIDGVTKDGIVRIYHGALEAAPKPQAAVLQLETQLSENDIKTLSDYIAWIKAPPAQKIGHSNLFQWCSPGDRQEPKWLLFFDDADRGYCYFTDEAEAIRRFNDAEDLGWNCHLFALMPRTPAQEAEPVVWMVGICRGLYTVHLQNQQEDHLWKFEREAHAETLAKGLNKYKLYTHAPSDKLRQAVQDALPMLEEAIELFDGKPDGTELVAALRAALEGKS